MRFERPIYPVDRYLVESSKKVEMVNIKDDDIWNPEPTLKPEDEIILRKLHEMLQSTADDLKLLSGELSKYHEPGVQMKTLPTPLDEEFNEKVHIEEVVSAKFHGHKIIDNSIHKAELKLKNKPNEMNTTPTKSNACVQVDTGPTVKKPMKNKKLQISRTKVIQIEGVNRDSSKEMGLNNYKKCSDEGAVKYNEFSYKYIEPKEEVTKKKLNVQKMPSINIRSELTEQRVLHLDILPETKEDKQHTASNSKIAVITLHHEDIADKKIISNEMQHIKAVSKSPHVKTRKVSRMSTGESSSTNVSSNAQNVNHKPLKRTLKYSPKKSSRIDHKASTKKSSDIRPQSNLEHWKKQLNSVYGQPSTSRKNKLPKTNGQKRSSKKEASIKTASNVLNNKTEYIPYSHLTIGGVSVSDIEREISDMPNKNDLPLSPILDKILSSRENSFHINSPQKNKDDNPKILTTSDENLLQEVIDIERTVTETLSRNLRKKIKTDTISPKVIASNGSKEDESYADDFEDEKSEDSKNSAIQNSSHDVVSLDETHSLESEGDNDNVIGAKENKLKNSDIHNRTYTKKSSLSFKNKVDIFEFVHCIDTQDSATQSTTSHKISLKETQTSPRNDRPNIQPIHNDLWPSIDPKEDVGKIFKLEKDLIKKLIIDEYGDLLEKNITKPSTSKELEETQNNVISLQKNTQTSPAHVKSMMTSPTRTKTRPTSPFTLTLPVDHQTSPMICVTNNDDLRVEIEDVEEDLGISINLSSPRFSLRLPQNSRDVLSNFEESNNQNASKVSQPRNNQAKKFRKFTVSSSSSSVDADNSSSDISSLGEVKLKLKRRLRKCKFSSISDSSSSSVPSHFSSDLQTISILPLRSEGELSLGQAVKKNLSKRESDGEINVRRLS